MTSTQRCQRASHRGPRASWRVSERRLPRNNVTALIIVKPSDTRKQIGFTDNDLRSPDHDTIMLWCETNIEMIASRVIGGKIRIDSTEWERPVVRNRNTNYANIVGFIDLFARVRCAEPDHLRRRHIRMPLGQACLNVSLCKDASHFYWEHWPSESECRWEVFEMAFEIKTKPPNIGELLRQIGSYKQYESGTYRKVVWVVVAPGLAPFTDLLRKQNVRSVNLDDFRWRDGTAEV